MLPRWGGGFGKLEEFARRSAKLHGGQDGELLYTRIVAAIVPMFHNVGPEGFRGLNFSYPRAKQGHIDFLEKYPDAWYYLNTYCLLASIYKDKKTAKELFERIGDNWDGEVWHKEEHFKKYQSWAYEPETSLSDPPTGFN